MISLASDFGIKDFRVSMMKAAILNEIPNVPIVDISHEISPFDLAEAAYVIRTAYKHFPKESIHVIGVDSMITPNKKPICTRFDEHYFISADNGILSLIGMEMQAEQMVELFVPKQVELSVIRDVFIPAACHIVRGGTLSVIGKPIESIKKLSGLKPIFRENNTLNGSVIYIDNFGNVVTNISQESFELYCKNRNFTIQVRNHEFREIHKTYTSIVRDFQKEELDFGKGMVLFNSAGFLEISIFKSNPKTVGSASTLFGLKKGDIINIMFH